MVLIEFIEDFGGNKIGDRSAVADSTAQVLIGRAKVAKMVDDPHQQPYERSIQQPAERAVTREAK